MTRLDAILSGVAIGFAVLLLIALWGGPGL